jgi:hypothetical protein
MTAKSVLEEELYFSKIILMQEKKAEVLIKKLDGTVQPFDEEKLRLSLDRSGASPGAIEYIVTHINNELSEGMTTSHIYKRAYKLLKEKEETSAPAARYSLKRAVMELGPTGFPFERFVGEIFKIKGYKITLGSILEGVCASHEIDILAEKGDELVLIETKFHNELKVKSDLKVALYVRARYDDLEKNNFTGQLKEKQKHQCWIITNTSFTKNAAKYGKCANMEMIGWSRPVGRSLQDLIEETALHPLTCLTALSVSEKNNILKTGNVLCRDVKNNPSLLESTGLSSKKASSVLEEISRVCVPRTH